MQVLNDLTICPIQVRRPVVLTIGSFDGLHLGHQKLFEECRNLAKGGSIVCLTFSNHPSDILKTNNKEQLIYTSAKKEELLETEGVDILYFVSFTPELASISYQKLLKMIQEEVSFDFLVLGKGAKIGYRAEGNEEAIQRLSLEMGFEIVYIEHLRHEKEIVSSTLIRQLIKEGNIKKASFLLGKPYTISGIVKPGTQASSLTGFPTGNIPIDTLCTPPQGVYAAYVTIKGGRYKGVINLGTAPTINLKKKHVLEVHVLDFNENLYDVDVEVELYSFIREEKKFDSVNDLKEQIEKDVQMASSLLS